MPFYFIDYWYIVLVVPTLILSLIIRGYLSSTYSKYSGVMSSKGMTADQIAADILRKKGINYVTIKSIAGKLTDNFNPKDNTVSLSQGVYGNSSVAAIGVACHEIGHAIQYDDAYLPIKVRNAMVPVVNITSSVSWIVIFLGLFMGSQTIAVIGVVLFSMTTIFHLVTLPVELNASKRALAIIREEGYLTEEESKGAKKVLTAAALTYVAALLTSIMSLLRVLLIVRRRD